MNFHPNVIIIGIGGCSRCGKTTLAREIINQYKNMFDKNSEFTDAISSIHLDRYFNMSKIHRNVIKTNQGNSYGNWEFPGALDWDKFYSDIQNEINKLNTKIKNSPFPNKKGILIIEGFLLYSPLMSNYNDNSNYLDLFDYYIYICLDKSIAKERRMKTTPVPPDYYDFILWPEHIKYCSEYVTFFKNKKNDDKNILIIDGNKQYDSITVALCILKWINASKRSDSRCNEIYKRLFTPMDNQLNLLQKNFVN